MSLEKVKNNIHKMVVETDDVVLLQQIEQYFKAMIDDSHDWFEDLNKNQKSRINQGLQDLENGKTISNTDMRTKINAFFDSKN